MDYDRAYRQTAHRRLSTVRRALEEQDKEDYPKALSDCLTISAPALLALCPEMQKLSLYTSITYLAVFL